MRMKAGSKTNKKKSNNVHSLELRKTEQFLITGLSYFKKVFYQIFKSVILISYY